MAEVVIWHNPRCSKSRRALELLRDGGADVTEVRYLDHPPTRTDLERVLAMLGTDDPRTIVRAGEPVYAELDLAAADRDGLLDAMAVHPILIERPIVIRGDRAVLARPPELAVDLVGPDA